MLTLLLLLACGSSASADRCASTDGDGDGFPLCEANGVAADCNDYLATVFPGAPESCDGLDSDCDGGIPADEIDADADGTYLCAHDCDTGNAGMNQSDWDGDGWTSCDGDCDDTSRLAYPGAPERCDAADNDCDDSIDEADGAEDALCGDTGAAP